MRFLIAQSNAINILPAKLVLQQRRSVRGASLQIHVSTRLVTKSVRICSHSNSNATVSQAWQCY